MTELGSFPKINACLWLVLVKKNCPDITVWLFYLTPPFNFFPGDPIVKIPNTPGSHNQEEQIKPNPSQLGHKGHQLKAKVQKHVFWA